MDDEFDIYGENFDDIRDRNQYPADQPEEKQIPDNPEGKVVPYPVDFYQPTPDEQWGFNRPNGRFAIYDPDNPDRRLMDSIEQEVIEISSPPILYYRLRPDKQKLDRLYGESLTREYEPPVLVFGNYEDPSIMQELIKYGIDQQETIDVFFNLNSLLKTVGEQVHIGGILKTYDGKLWEVMTSTVQDEPLWRAIHNNVKAIRLQTEGIILPDAGNISRAPGADRDPNPDLEDC